MFSKSTIRRALLTVAILLASALLARAGGNNIFSVQDGNWSDSSTWDNGVPSAGAFADVVVEHAVDVVSAGQSANSLIVRAGETLHVDGGELDLTRRLNLSSSGNTLVSSGLLETGLGFLVGTGGGSSSNILTISGGIVRTDQTPTELTVGVNASGTLVIEGASATISLPGASSDMNVQNLGRMVIRPTANGAAGLSTIDVGGDLTLQAGSELVLDTSLYTPSPGDAWDIISYAGTLSGNFGSVTSNSGIPAVVSDTSTPGIVTITIPTALPALPPLALGLMAAALLSAGGRLLARR